MPYVQEFFFYQGLFGAGKGGDLQDQLVELARQTALAVDDRVVQVLIRSRLHETRPGAADWRVTISHKNPCEVLCGMHKTSHGYTNGEHNYELHHATCDRAKPDTALRFQRRTGQSHPVWPKNLVPRDYGRGYLILYDNDDRNTTMTGLIGEDSWIAYIEEQDHDAVSVEECIRVDELYKRAINAEPASIRLWLTRCQYFWSLWVRSQPNDGIWPDHEQTTLARELFTFGAALDLWQQAYEAIKYRIDESHLLWDRWLSIELEQLAKTKTPDGVRRVTHLYRDRLATPHLSWAETSQAFCTFLSEYNPTGWEDTMVEITALSQGAKQAVAARDAFECKLKEASCDDDVKSVMRDYLEWEIRESQGKASGLCCGLFERALSSLFVQDDGVWQEYIVFVSSTQLEIQDRERFLDVPRRAVQHCPWSGQLWNRYLLCAEVAKLPFPDIESIKHSATSENQLYKNGMESMIETYVAWCGYLKRNALDPDAESEAVDLADVGLRAALEDVAVVGKRLYGKEFQGDPKFRLERIYIQYLTEKKGAIEEARAVWRKLSNVQIHADSYDFWLCYYTWEMLVFSSNSQPCQSTMPSPSVNSSPRVPKHGTAVLRAAATRKTIDWPERILEVYLQHCNDWEYPTLVRGATDLVHEVGKEVRQRRQREEEARNAALAAFYGESEIESAAVSGSKRKRSEDKEDDGDEDSKRQRTGPEDVAPSSSAEANAKRNRENATIIVTGLPADVTNTKVRQYFRKYGHINSVTALVREEDGTSSTALIEFASPDEAQSALLRDGKYFGQSQLSVQSGCDLTVYVANFPPVADDKYIRDLFKDCGEILSIRRPSLTVNTHRRFCYVSFRDRAASAKAVSKEGTLLNGKFSLLAKYSDPSRKKDREGAVAEGREVIVKGLDKAATEDEIRHIFSKLGNVTRVNLPVNIDGKNRSYAFVAMETKEEAEKATEEMNNTKLRNQILRVELSKESKVKHAAKTTTAGEPASPSPKPVSSAEAGKAAPSAADIATRTVALMGLPDTVNDARIRALVEPLGAIVQLVLQPAHGGAKIEFADAATAGKAALQLEGFDFDGHKLQTGSVDDLRHAKADRTDDRIVYGAGGSSSGGNSNSKSNNSKDFKPHLMVPLSLIRRPGGPKRRIGLPTRRAHDAKPAEAEGEKPSPMTNDDFRARFLGVAEEKKDGADGAEGDA
ncbi:hypothetical protein CP532_1069 [Ophiocordyceps camponoti-leonardi (nom. inval.)]|nr:hypothetical protein CP532_1069 [Ophiocordyceps camponoti-leonardi (nom. inval.)]